MKLKVSLFIGLLIATTSTPCQGFWAANDQKSNTHRRLAEHAIAELSDKDFPDIHKFGGPSHIWLKNGIYAGAINEDSHNHRWRGHWEYWEKKSIAAYQLGFFDDAYTMMGNAIHLHQDDQAIPSPDDII